MTSKNNPAESAVESTEGKSGGRHRNRYYAMAAQDGKKIIMDLSPGANLEEAKEYFENTHGKPPVVWHDGSGIEKGKGGNGLYLAMGTGASAAQRVSVTVSARQLKSLTGSSFEGQFKGWVVVGNGLKSCKINGVEYDDDELIAIEFDTLVDDDQPVEKPKIKKREVIPAEKIANLKEL